MTVSLVAYLLIPIAVGVVSFVVGLRLGAGARTASPPSEDDQVAAAFGVLRRYFEKKALSEMQASGAPLWSPDPDRVADLCHGLQADAPVSVGRNAKATHQFPDRS